MEKSKDVYIKKGSIYKCVFCSENMFEAHRDFSLGERLMADMLIGIQKEVLNGDPIGCRSCGKNQGVEIYFSEYWISDGND